jgi:carbon monoxide dehydrogenase subunit G
MPEATLRFHTPADPPTLKRLLSDVTFVAGGIPQVVGVEKTSETTARWTVQIKLGPITRKSLYDGELLEATDRGVRFRAIGPEATIDGTLTFEPNSAGGTEVSLTLSMKGSGPLRAVIDSYLSKRVREDAQKFAESLENRVGGAPTASA